MHRSVKRALGLGIVSGVAFAAWRTWNARVGPRPQGVEWSTAPFPFPPVPHGTTTGSAPAKAAATTSAPAETGETAPGMSGFVDPDGEGACPVTHPVKAKLASGIYHRPGTGNYTRTKADRCYVDADAAEADGLRASKT